MSTVSYRVETPTGRVLERHDLPDLPERVTVRDLVRHRVREEVARRNAEPERHLGGPVPPTPVELLLNGYARTRGPLDWETHADAAERAFESNGFVVLVGDRQVEDLDETVDPTADPEVVFVRLVPLVGG